MNTANIAEYRALATGTVAALAHHVSNGPGYSMPVAK